MRRLASRQTTLMATAMLCLTAVGVADAALKRPTVDDAQVLLASEKAWAQAPVDGDADRMASYMADEYLELIWEPAASGAPAHWSVRGKKEWVESVRSHKSSYTSVDLHNLTVHVQGSLAVVTGEYSQKGVSDGKDNSSSGIYANTWIKRGGKWLAVHSVFP